MSDTTLFQIWLSLHSDAAQIDKTYDELVTVDPKPLKCGHLVLRHFTQVQIVFLLTAIHYTPPYIIPPEILTPHYSEKQTHCIFSVPLVPGLYRNFFYAFEI